MLLLPWFSHVGRVVMRRTTGTKRRHRKHQTRGSNRPNELQAANPFSSQSTWARRQCMREHWCEYEYKYNQQQRRRINASINIKASIKTTRETSHVSNVNLCDPLYSLYLRMHNDHAVPARSPHRVPANRIRIDAILFLHCYEIYCLGCIRCHCRSRAVGDSSRRIAERLLWSR